MIAKAETKYIRNSARKLRLVIDLIKGKTVEEAIFLLESINKGASRPIKKVLNSAFANANFNRQEKILSKDMFISAVRADDGPMLKRYRAATMGRATPIRHRTAHICVELDQVAGDTPKRDTLKRKKAEKKQQVAGDTPKRDTLKRKKSEKKQEKNARSGDTPEGGTLKRKK